MSRYISVASPALVGNERKYVLDCIESGWISSVGSYISRFEDAFSKFIGTKYAISCSNGTVALHLALMALGIKSEDEVIVPTLTYIATANAIKYCGAKPIFIDSEPQTWNMDPLLIEKRISKKTRAIMVVHLYGHPTNMRPILRIARKYKLSVIEDAAESHGAKFDGRMTGSLGDIATFSFFGNKIITTGEGGMITTNNRQLANKVMLLKGQGMDPKRRYWFKTVGYNYRMTNIQAAIGLAQLEKVDWHLMKRQEIAQLYYKYLTPLSNSIEMPEVAGWASHSFWMYSIKLRRETHISRDKLRDLLAESGIETRPVFYPMHIMPPYIDHKMHFPVAEQIAKRSLNLPTHAFLKESDIEYISMCIHKALKQGRNL